MATTKTVFKAHPIKDSGKAYASFATASKDDVKSRAVQVSQRWTREQRAERKRSGAERRAWLVQLIVGSQCDTL
jgi:hypothetical protein